MQQGQQLVRQRPTLAHCGCSRQPMQRPTKLHPCRCLAARCRRGGARRRRPPRPRAPLLLTSSPTLGLLATSGARHPSTRPVRARVGVPGEARCARQVNARAQPASASPPPLASLCTPCPQPRPPPSRLASLLGACRQCGAARWGRCRCLPRSRREGRRCSRRGAWAAPPAATGARPPSPRLPCCPRRAVAVAACSNSLAAAAAAARWKRPDATRQPALVLILRPHEHQQGLCTITTMQATLVTPAQHQTGEACTQAPRRPLASPRRPTLINPALSHTNAPPLPLLRHSLHALTPAPPRHRRPAALHTRTRPSPRAATMHAATTCSASMAPLSRQAGCRGGSSARARPALRQQCGGGLPLSAARPSSRRRAAVARGAERGLALQGGGGGGQQMLAAPLARPPPPPPHPPALPSAAAARRPAVCSAAADQTLALTEENVEVVLDEVRRGGPRGGRVR